MYRTLVGDLQPRVIMAWAILLIVALGGGSSWPDAASLLYVRPALVVFAVVALALHRHQMWGMRSAALLLAGLAGWIAIQLVPLPPFLWTKLPGHGLIASIGNAAGVPAAWRPITISPDATLNSLLACIPAVAALAVVATLGGHARRSLVGALLVLVVASMTLGALQLASGGNAAFLLYRRTDEDTAVGLFANRNHYALLLASGLPLLGAWSLGRGGDDKNDNNPGRLFLAGLGALFILVMIIATGSRAGLALGAAGTAAGALIHWRNAARGPKAARSTRRRLLIALACGALVVLVLGATIAFKGIAVQRLFGTIGDLGAEKRATLTPVMLAAIGLYFPFGSGFGTFDRMFRQIEPDWALTPTYFNHAHNEALELALTGGLPAMLIAIGFGVALVRLGRRATMLRAGAPAAFAQAGLTVILLTLLASLVDYPLRTPLIDVTTIFALAIASAGDASRGRRSRQGSAVALDTRQG